jgi:phosphonate degradation associated HDIG domain protein
MSYSSVVEIVRLLKRRGAQLYGGEAVTQLDHALQCASLAEEAGADDPLITAALLHDIAHLLEPRDGHGLAEDDYGHECIGARFLLPELGAPVAEPVRLHVSAKRYLCAQDLRYYQSLSPASKHSLALQGGPFSASEAEAFLAEPYAEDAVHLRRWDDGAKVAGVETQALAHFAAIVERVAARH